MHLNSRLTDRVLLAAGRNHPTDITGCPVTGQIPSLYYDSRHCIHHSDRVRAECSCPLTGNAPNVALGEESVYTGDAARTPNEPAHLPVPGKLRRRRWRWQFQRRRSQEIQEQLLRHRLRWQQVSFNFLIHLYT